MVLSRRHAVAGVAVLIVLAASLLASPTAFLDRIRGLLFSPWFPVVLLGLYAVRPALAWPISVLSALVGFRYGLVVGLPTALVGVVATSLVPYAVARRLRPAGREGAFGRAIDASDRFFATTGDLRGVLAARLAPVPADVISGAAGVAGVSVPAFVVGTAVGELPWTMAAVAAGTSMGRFAAEGVTFDPRLVVVGVFGAGLLLVGPVVRLGRNAIDRVRGRGWADASR